MGDCKIRKQLNVRTKTGLLLSDDRKNTIGGILKYGLTEHSLLVDIRTLRTAMIRQSLHDSMPLLTRLSKHDDASNVITCHGVPISPALYPPALLPNSYTKYLAMITSYKASSDWTGTRIASALHTDASLLVLRTGKDSL